LNVIAVGCLGLGNAKTVDRPLSLPHTFAANLEPHPNADRSKLGRFDFLTEYSDPAFMYMKPISFIYGEQYEKIINN